MNLSVFPFHSYYNDRLCYFCSAFRKRYDFVVNFLNHTHNQPWDKTFTYDGLNRLVTASGPWGTGSFSYDNRNNLTQKRLGSVTRSMGY